MQNYNWTGPLWYCSFPTWLVINRSNVRDCSSMEMGSNVCSCVSSFSSFDYKSGWRYSYMRSLWKWGGVEETTGYRMPSRPLGKSWEEVQTSMKNRVFTFIKKNILASIYIFSLFKMHVSCWTTLIWFEHI